jgi:hypothetical protein
MLHRLCKRADLSGITIHVLQRTFAVIAAKLGFTEFINAGPLGHTVIGITLHYTHVPDSALVFVVPSGAPHRSSRCEAAPGRYTEQEFTARYRPEVADFVLSVFGQAKLSIPRIGRATFSA